MLLLGTDTSGGDAKMEVSVKTVLVLTIMVCCFAVLVPKIFQPMLLNFLGRGRDAKDTKKVDHSKHCHCYWPLLGLVYQRQRQRFTTAGENNLRDRVIDSYWHCGTPRQRGS